MSKDRRGARWLSAWLAAGLIFHPPVVLTAATAASVVLRIVEASADFDDGLLRVNGENFLRSTSDVVYVSLSGQMLAVVSRTPAELVARLPAGIVPGTYRLVVVRSGLIPLADAMDVTLGVVGPRGEPGEAGPKGERGRRSGTWCSRSSVPSDSWQMFLALALCGGSSTRFAGRKRHSPS